MPSPSGSSRIAVSLNLRVICPLYRLVCGGIFSWRHATHPGTHIGSAQRLAYVESSSVIRHTRPDSKRLWRWLRNTVFAPDQAPELALRVRIPDSMSLNLPDQETVAISGCTQSHLKLYVRAE